MLYRLAEKKDYEQLEELRYTHLRQDETEPRERFCRETFRTGFFRFLEEELNRSFFVFVAEEEGALVANIYLGLQKRVPKPYADAEYIGYVTNVHTKKAFRNRGVGSRLLQEVKSFAKQKNCELLYVWPSESARSFYRANGFLSETDVMVCPL